MMYPTAHGVFETAIILPTLGTVAVALRFYARKTNGIKLGIDDWTIVLALVLTWVLATIMLVGYAIGSFSGHPLFNHKTGAIIYNKHEVKSVKVKFAYNLVMALAFGVIKLSVIFLYRRLFVGRLFNRYSLALCTLIALWSLSFFFATAFQCGTHIAYWWTSQATIKRFCVDTNALNLGFSISDVITDLMVLAIPLPIIWKLQMSTPQKLGLTSIFLLGLLSTAAGVARMRTVIIDVYGTKRNYRDLISRSRDVAVWSQVEAGVAVIAACLPTIRPLFRRPFPGTRKRSWRSMLSLKSLEFSRRTAPEGHGELNNQGFTGGSRGRDGFRKIGG